MVTTLLILQGQIVTDVTIVVGNTAQQRRIFIYPFTPYHTLTLQEPNGAN